MSQMFARGLIITPIDEKGRPLFALDGDRLTISKPGVYQLQAVIGVDPAHQRAATESEINSLLNDLLDPEPCRLDHDGDCQEHNWFNSDRSCPMERVRHHFGYPIEFNPPETEPDVEQLTGIRNGLALTWLQAGTLDLPALAASAGMSVDQGAHQHDVLRVRPQAASAFSITVNEGDGERVQLDGRSKIIPTDTQVKLADQSGSLPAVWVQQSTGHDLRMGAERFMGANAPVVRVFAYCDSDRQPESDARAELNAATEAFAKEQAARMRQIFRLAGDVEDARKDRGQRAQDLAVARADLVKQGDTLARVGRFMQVQANRVEQVARAMMPQGGSAEFYALCDIMARLRESSQEDCGVPYAEPTEPLDPNADVPWGLREWALLARQTMEQQALQLNDELQVIGHEARSRLFRMVGVLHEAVAQYPEDLDAVQAEQATRNADAEAVRRLAHAMTEVANQLETVADWEHVDTASVQQMTFVARKLRDTVNAWTTEEQRRPWAEATSGPVGFTVPADIAEGYDTVPKLTEVMAMPENPAAEKLARTMQAAATGLEATYRPGKPPYVVANIIQHLRTDSAPWLSTAEQQAEGQPVSTTVTACAHTIRDHVSDGCRHCDCTRRRHEFAQQFTLDTRCTYAGQVRQLQFEVPVRPHPMEAPAPEGPREAIGVADLPGDLVHLLHTLAGLLEGNRGRWLEQDAIKAAMARYRLREFLGLGQ